MENPEIFPIRLQGYTLPWKLQLNYDLEAKKFQLKINDVPFDRLKYSAQAVHEGPPNIETGKIVLNGREIHEGVFIFYNFNSFDCMRRVSGMYRTTTEFKLQSFSSTSSGVLNSVISDITRSISDNPVPFAL